MTKQACIIITWNFPPKTGGMENLLFCVHRALTPHHIVTVIAPNAAPPHDKGVLRCPFKGLIPFFLFALWAGLKQTLFQKKTIIGGSFLMAPLTWVLGTLSGNPVILYVHGLDLIYPSRLYQLMVKHFIRQKGPIITVSNHTKRLAVAKGADIRDIQIIHPTLPPEFQLKIHQARTRAEQLKAIHGLTGKHVVLSVGRLTHRKGLAAFIRHSYRHILKQVPETVLLIVGEEPKEALAHHAGPAASIHAEVKLYGLESQVRMLGFVSDTHIKELYNICDMLVFPVITQKGDTEGFGIVALEAASAEKMVVGTRSGGIPDAVEHGRTGILLEPEDYSAMTHAIVWGLTNPEKRTRMGIEGRKRFNKRFSFQEFQKKWLRALTVSSPWIHRGKS